ncbi:MAG: acetyl-CoA hydrolase/transferase C-terminal domain-containing protein [Pseudomonadota bacterium]
MADKSSTIKLGDDPGRLLTAGDRVFVQGCSGESNLWLRWLLHHSSKLRDVGFAGVLIPGVNTFDYSELGLGCTLDVIFMQPAFRRGYELGRIEYRPLTYSSTVEYYERGPQFDVCLLQASMPDEKGNCSLGVSADFSPSALKNTRSVALHLNPQMPKTHGPSINLADTDFTIEADVPLLQLPSDAPSGTLTRVAANVSSLIESGDTVQFGLGKLQRALCESLANHRGLKVHSGMISDPVAALLAGGAIDEVVTGTAIGTDSLYSVCSDPRITFAPVSRTHSARTLTGLRNLKCVNSVMQIDLLGQANSEWLRGRQLSGCGGLMDFGKGCRQHPENAFILATPATAKNGESSTIVPRLPDGNSVSVTRQDVDYVVTEHGVADLRHRSVAERADALITVAAPQFRDMLTKSWRDDIAPRI